MDPKCFPVFPSSMFDEGLNFRKLKISEYAKASAQQLQNDKVEFIYFLYFCAFAKLIKKFSFMDISIVMRK